MDIKEYINNYSLKKGLGASESDEEFYEILRNEKTLAETFREEHRWYYCVAFVVKIGDRFVEYNDIEVEGEVESPEDCGLEYRFYEVEPYKTKIVKYRPISENN